MGRPIYDEQDMQDAEEEATAWGNAQRRHLAASQKELASLRTALSERDAKIGELTSALEKLLGTDQFGFHEKDYDKSRERLGVWINSEDFHAWLYEGRAVLEAMGGKG